MGDKKKKIGGLEDDQKIGGCGGWGGGFVRRDGKPEEAHRLARRPIATC